MNVSEWIDRLEKTFSENGVIGNSLLEVIKAEIDYKPFITKTFKGYLVLTDSFLSFFFDTLKFAEDQFHERAAGTITNHYPFVLWIFSTAFRKFRAAENLLLCGYSFSGYALIRDLKDQAIILGAIGNNITTYPKVSGVQQNEEEIENDLAKLHEIKKRRKKEEKKVFNQMIRSESGLPKDCRQELELWENLFHVEVHGSRLNIAYEFEDWIKGKTDLPIIPNPTLDKVSMYLNRSNEIGWMLLKTLPLLQLSSGAFGTDWSKKWKVLDESFQVAIEGLEQAGKKFASAIICLIESKFSFQPEKTCYAEITE